MKGIWSRWCPEGNHSNNKIQPQLTPAYNNSTSSLQEKRHAHLQGINIYLTLYCPTHEQNDDQSNVTRHTESKKKTGHCQETKNNKTKFRDDSDVVVIKEIKITKINILKALVENMGNMYEQIQISTEVWEL